ncbi:MAG: hypothetical protein ACTTKL_05075 [Treponema sp.]
MCGLTRLYPCERSVTCRALAIMRFSEDVSLELSAPLSALECRLRALYATGFSDVRDYAEYKNICRRARLEFGGEVQTPLCAD